MMVASAEEVRAVMDAERAVLMRIAHLPAATQLRRLSLLIDLAEGRMAERYHRMSVLMHQIKIEAKVHKATTSLDCHGCAQVAAREDDGRPDRIEPGDLYATADRDGVTLAFCADCATKILDLDLNPPPEDRPGWTP